MGLVYRVNQILLNKEFALKTIDKNKMSEIAIRRFQQEARTAFALDHPSIIAVKDFGVLDDQTPFLVMELVKGETLGERLKRAGCLTLDQAIPFFVQVCFGLAYAHECGVVHRDIKPNNIMLLTGLPLATEGSVKIVDFGIAKFSEHEGGEMQSLTRTGEIFGSPLYMSPEQCSGFKVDHRSDIYSLGCVLFEALTGTPPFMGDNALSTMMKHLGEPAPTLKEASLGADFSQAIEDIVAKMLAKSPDRRYQNLGVVAHDLGALRRGESISGAAKSSPVAVQASRGRPVSMRRNSFYALMLGISMLSAVIAGVSGYMLHNFQNGGPRVQPKIESSQKEFVTNSPVPLDLDTDDRPAISTEELKKLLAQPQPDKRFALRNRKITDEAIELIASTSWIHLLTLHGCDISNASLARLAKLNLAGINFGESTFNDIGAGSLSVCQGLRQINATSTDLSDEGVIKLATIKSLIDVTLAHTKVTDKSLIELGKSRDLIFLKVDGAKQITNRGLMALEKMHLHELYLEGTQVDDAGMVYLSKIDSLKIVDLNRTRVTIDGIKELCRGSKNLKKISLYECPNLGQKELQSLQTAFPAIRFIDRPDKVLNGELLVR
jgi:serine/threonine protein kinase